jgi:hypothetical protein
VALLHVLYGTGMTATELALLEVADVLTEQGAFRRESEVRAAMSFNGRRRPVFWTNTRVCASLDAYFNERVTSGHGVTAWRSQWRALVHLGPVFLTSDGRPFTLTTRKTSAGDAVSHQGALRRRPGGPGQDRCPRALSALRWCSMSSD